MKFNILIRSNLSGYSYFNFSFELKNRPVITFTPANGIQKRVSADIVDIVDIGKWTLKELEYYLNLYHPTETFNIGVLFPILNQMPDSDYFLLEHWEESDLIFKTKLKNYLENLDGGL